jgi:hypothetical protein
MMERRGEIFLGEGGIVRAPVDIDMKSGGRGRSWKRVSAWIVYRGTDDRY